MKALTVVGLILIILGVVLASEMILLSVTETVHVKVSKTAKTAPAIAFPYYEAYECNPDWSLKYTLFTPIDTRDVVGQLRLQFGLTDVTLDHEDNSWWYYVGTRVFEQPQPTTAPSETTTVYTTPKAKIISCSFPKDPQEAGAKFKVSFTIKNVGASGDIYYKVYDTGTRDMFASWVGTMASGEQKSFDVIITMPSRNIEYLQIQAGHVINNFYYYWDDYNYKLIPLATTETTTTSGTTTTIPSTLFSFAQKNLGIVMALAGLFLVIWGERRR